MEKFKNLETGVELNAADKREVSKDNDEYNAKTTQPVKPPPITTPAPTAKPTAKIKRTMKQEAAINEQTRPNCQQSTTKSPLEINKSKSKRREDVMSNRIDITRQI